MKQKGRWGLAALLVFYVFLMMLAAMLLAGILVMIFNRLGIPLWVHEADADFRPIGLLAGMTVLSIGIGTAMASFFSRHALRPIRRLVEAMRKVAQGDFTVRAEGKDSIHELEDLYTSFNQMTRELSSTQTLRNDFINNFSHEFKTPIVSIRGFAKLLKEGDLTEAERQEYLEIIIAESQRLSALATNVLNLSKYEAMEIVAKKEAFRLDEQLRRTIAMTEPLWAEKSLNMDIALEEVTFNGNADLIQQAWLNLIDNAIKFSPIGGRCIMRLIHLHGKVRFTLQDEGEGMDEETQGHIFDKFYQGDASHSRTGNGLGLPMVRRIVELHGGGIYVKSAPNEGSAFEVILPM
ncbi:MAG: HAMP domain-containing histidine kinase [Defluviitaleaceae bacterium]|nr:HAMP domain-containing histidine kinase [Defluviitaleaceae bacterium]MCL2274949.1 HAMP domain-containing histidine kinase [Defluviitaleaceae bacterium]